jgi:hypothetical protein
VLAFRGACGEPPRRFAPLGVSPVPLLPQDKEGFGSFISHEENVKFIFEESRTLRSNQLVKEAYTIKMVKSNEPLIKCCNFFFVFLDKYSTDYLFFIFLTKM